MSLRNRVTVIGAGLAGSEAALVLARAGVDVTLVEMRPGTATPAHKTALPAELVCSNSLKSSSPTAAHGVLKQELEVLDSPLIRIARANSVPAGSALAVDRIRFSKAVLEAIQSCGRVTMENRECVEPPRDGGPVIIAAGPLASPALTAWLKSTVAGESLFFYDAIAPIVATDSIDRTIAFQASRNQDGEGDYLNCPFEKDEFLRFHKELVEADQVAAREFEDARYFEACLPVEVIAGRGVLALAFGTMRPIGLVDPRTGRRPYAVVQLRRETLSGESYGLVGFQTRLRVPEQQRVFRTIPGLANAEFLSYGSIHRNTYLDSPRLLSGDLSFRAMPDVFLAGQLSGGEGYTESVTTGHIAALSVLHRLGGSVFAAPPATTCSGALLAHILGSPVVPFTPSNVNFGLLAPLELPQRRTRVGKREKKELLAVRAVEDMRQWISSLTHLHLR